MQARRDILSSPSTAMRDRHLVSPVPLSVVLLSASFAGLSLAPAAAQVTAPSQQTSAQQAAAASPDAIKQREQELEAARLQQKNAPHLHQKLKSTIAPIVHN